MREFLFTLTYNNLTDKKELNFIVGETSTPPTWNTVKDHVTKITRAFDGDSLNTRRIYFSATEKLTGIGTDPTTDDATMSGAVVNLSQAGKTEIEITKVEAPGIMVPANSYYVFVYDKDGRLVKQQDVTTADYPDESSDFTPQVGGSDRTISQGSSADLGEYIWGMDGWKNSSGVYDTVKGVEVKQGEVFFLPLRFRSPDDWDIQSSNYCTGSSGEIHLDKGIGTNAPLPLVSFTPTDTDSTSATVSDTTNLFSFANSPQLFSATPTVLPVQDADETLDLMYLAQVGANEKRVIYELLVKCLVGITSPLTRGAYTNPYFTLITQ